MRRLPICAVALAVAWLASPAGAQPVVTDLPRLPVDITADEIESDWDRDIHTARGNVVIVQDGRTLRADWVSFSNRTGRGVASGNVRLSDAGETLLAELIQYDTRTLQGVVYDGRLASGPRGFRLEGREVRKTGEATYEFEDGVFTTCRCPGGGRDPWKIRAQQAEVEVGGYGTARNSTFDILGIPVIWLPWMIYPLKTERQTGFLLPELSASGRNGAEVGLPFFWAARDDLNVLITPRWLSDRGFKPEIETEYVFGERSEGTFFASYLSDGEVDEDGPETPFDDQRWAFLWEHDQDLPGSIRLQADVKMASDNDHPFDFSELDEYRRDRFLESDLFLTRHFGSTGRFGLVAGGRFADDLQSPNNIDRDDFLLQRPAEIDFSALPAPGPGPWLSWLVPAFDVEYAWFRGRDRAGDDRPTGTVVGDGVFIDTGIDGANDLEESRNRRDDRIVDESRDNFDPVTRAGGTENNGRFEEGEPLADIGHRVVLRPRLGAPHRIADLFEIYPEVGYHAALYQTREQGFDERGFLSARLDARTRLRGAFDLPFGLGRALHVVEPQIGYALVQRRSQGESPLFRPATARPQERVRQLHLDNVTLDDADRVDRYNGVTIGVANRVYARPARSDGSGAAGVGRLLADFTVSSQYLFSEGEPGGLVLEGTLWPRRSLRTRFIVGWNLDESELSEGFFQLGYFGEGGSDLFAGYRFVRDIPRFFEAFRSDRDRFREFDDSFGRVNQVSLNGRLALPARFAVTYNGSYSFEASEVLDNRLGLEYVSKCLCWAVRLEVEDDRSRGTQVELSYTLIGLGQDAVRPFQGGRSGLLDGL